MDNINLHKGHRSRLRELSSRVGVANLQEHQALELLLTYVIPQKDVNPIAHRLIKTFGSFSQVLDAEQAELVKVKGVGETTANFLHTYKEFFSIYQQQKVGQKAKITNTKEATEVARQYLSHKLNEELYLICLDGGSAIKRIEKVSEGTSNATSVNIRKIVEMVFATNTHNVILAHNHPDGEPHPSIQDDKMTKAILMALSINNINLLDHIIVGKHDYYSYSLSGKLVNYANEMTSVINSGVLMQNRSAYNEDIK